MKTSFKWSRYRGTSIASPVAMQQKGRGIRDLKPYVIGFLPSKQTCITSVRWFVSGRSGLLAAAVLLTDPPVQLST